MSEEEKKFFEEFRASMRKQFAKSRMDENMSQEKLFLLAHIFRSYQGSLKLHQRRLPLSWYPLWEEGFVKWKIPKACQITFLL